MFYRRKVMLALLQNLKNNVPDKKFQRSLFLYTKEQERENLKPSYFFVPGVISFQANADRSTMVKYGLLSESRDFWEKLDLNDYASQLKKEEQEVLENFLRKYSSFSNNKLLKYIEKEYPYYSRDSKFKQVNRTKKLFTIGYEGISLEEYLNKLLENEVSLLVDVRKNAFSMKYGFSKNQLRYALHKMGIKYIQISELGIDSFKRKNLNSKRSYEKLFEEYEERIRKSNMKELSLIREKLESLRSVALTCFEKDSNYCHRSRIAKVLNEENPDFDKYVFHL